MTTKLAVHSPKQFEDYVRIVAEEIERGLDDSISLAQQHRDIMQILGARMASLREAGRLQGLEEAASAMCKGCQCGAATKEYTFGPNCADVTQTWHVDTGGCQWLKCSAVPIRQKIKGAAVGEQEENTQ